MHGKYTKILFHKYRPHRHELYAKIEKKIELIHKYTNELIIL